MRPVEDALASLGCEIVRYTADTEAVFQVGLQQEAGIGLENWQWLPDYHDAAAAQKLYQTHVAYFREKLATPNALSLMLPQVLDRIIYSSCHEWVATRNLLRSVRPTACLVLHELNRWSMMLAAHAAAMNLPVWSLQEGMYYANPWLYTGHTRYSRSLVWGEATRDVLRQAGCAAERVEILGHPDLGSRWQHAQEEVRAGTLQPELPAAAQGKRLALAFLPHIKLGEHAGMIMQGLAGSDWFLVCRNHQLAALPLIQALAALFGTCPANSWLSPLAMPRGHHWRLMAAAECMIVVGCSTTMLEWLWSGKPLGHVPLFGEPRDLAAEGLAVPCDGAAGYLLAIEKTMAEWDDGYRARARQFVGREVAAGDAASAIARRIAKYCSREVA